MARLFDRVKETTTTTGTGDIALAGAATRMVAFSARYAAGDENIPYAIEAQSGSEWEVGLGTYVSADTLRRDKVFASSNADALVNFSAGTKDVWVDAPAEIMDVTGKKVALMRGMAMP